MTLLCRPINSTERTSFTWSPSSFRLLKWKFTIRFKPTCSIDCKTEPSKYFLSTITKIGALSGLAID